MYILKFHGRDELCQMCISESIPILKMRAIEEVGTKKMSFKKIGEFIFIYDGDEEIGVIGHIEEIES